MGGQEKERPAVPIGWKAGKEETQAGAAEKEEGQPFSQGGWPCSLLLPQRL